MYLKINDWLYSNPKKKELVFKKTEQTDINKTYIHSHQYVNITSNSIVQALQSQ